MEYFLPLRDEKVTTSSEQVNAYPTTKGKVMPRQYDSGRVNEWAKDKHNFQDGCEHGCLYCYAWSYKKEWMDNIGRSWLNPTINFKKANQGFRKRAEGVLVASAHDITPRNIDSAINVLKGLTDADNEVLLVSKAYPECIKRIVEEVPRTDKILFRITIGSSDNKTLRFWEPGAPKFEDRLEALKIAFDAGVETSLSCEPVLDKNIEAVIEAARPYVTHTIWIGLVNELYDHMKKVGTLNGKTRLAADKLHKEIYTEPYIKNLLKKYGNDPLFRWKGNIKNKAKKEGGLPRSYQNKFKGVFTKIR